MHTSGSVPVAMSTVTEWLSKEWIFVTSTVTLWPPVAHGIVPLALSTVTECPSQELLYCHKYTD